MTAVAFRSQLQPDLRDDGIGASAVHLKASPSMESQDRRSRHRLCWLGQM
jgi:hypothetical protein